MPGIAANKICLIRTSALGDTVHALSFVNALRRGYPDAHLTWVLQTFPYEMVKHQPAVDRFITFDRKGGPKDWLTLFSRLHREHFDLAIIPQTSDKASLITFFTPADFRLGFDSRRGRILHRLVTNRHIPARPIGHAQDHFFEFLDYLGIERTPVEWNFVFTNEERRCQRELFAGIARPAVGFVVATTHPEKDWPARNHAQVMDYVHEKLDMQPVIIGGPGPVERRMADEIASTCRCSPLVWLENSIRKAMLRIDGCRLLVSPDTAPLHIGVALDVPAVGIYGFTNPRRCGPYNRFLDLVIDKYNEPGQPPAPITRRTKPGRTAAVTPEEVIEKIELGLNRYPPKSGHWQTA